MSIDARSFLSGKDATHIIDDLPDAELIFLVHELQAETKRLELENQIFENFLRASEPALIAGMLLALEAVRKMKQQLKTQSVPATIVSTEHDSIRRESVRESHAFPLIPATPTSKTSIALSDTDSVDVKKCSIQSGQYKGPRINISQKTDLVMREIEEMQNTLKRFFNASHRKKNKLNAEIEESNIRSQEVSDTIKSFEQDIVIGAKEKLTQKIPAEKYVRYMQEWLKCAQFMLEKLRLRTSSLRIHETKLKALLNQKEELGECVHEVDFEKLKIENKNFAIKMEQKNHHLLELKHINAKAYLMLTNHKKILEKQGEELNTLKRSIKGSQKRIVELETETELSQQEVQDEQERFRHLKKLSQLYSVPDVMEYIHKKAELHELQRTLKVWRRKRNIQKISLSTYTKMMMHLTNEKKPKSCWYDPNKSVDILELEDYSRNFAEERCQYSTSVKSIDILGYRDDLK